MDKTTYEFLEIVYTNLFGEKPVDLTFHEILEKIKDKILNIKEKE